MGISSALNAGIMGLAANSSKLATISDNIANSETKGYKRSDVEFSSLVVGQRSTGYDAGGVRVTPRRDIESKGALLSTRNVTDLALGGGGFFPVTNVADIGEAANSRSFKLTPTASFRPDANGVLSTADGLALLGWEADSLGNVAVQPRETQAGLTPVIIDALDIASEATTEIDISANLPASGATDPTLAVTDPNYAAPDTRATYSSLPTEYIDILGGSKTLSISFANTEERNAGGVATNDPATAPAAYARLPENTWRMYIDDGEGYRAVIDMEFDATPGNGGQLGAVSIGAVTVVDDRGTAATADDFVQNAGAPTPPATVGGAAPTYDPNTGILQVVLTTGQSIDINIGQLGTRDGLRQLDASFQPITIERDGFPAARLSGIEVNAGGVLDAVYDSGFRRTLYQIPVAQVPNPNGLRAASAQTFELSNESGAFFLYNAGEGPTGEVISNALEESNTDVAQELTSLIKTQRAYSSNATVIRTVDEMLQETTNLKR